MTYLIYVLILIFSISQDLLLFNEESLILICFISFSWLFIKNIGTGINEYFQNESKKIEGSIFTSYNDLLIKIKNKLQVNYKKLILKTYFIKIKEYYLKVNFKLINKLIDLQITKKQINFNTKLYFAYNIEQQFKKLIILLIITKINKLIFLNLFCSKTLKINKFYCFYKICLREYLKLI